MTHKASALGMALNVGKRETHGLKPVMMIALSVVAIALAVASVYGLVTVLRPEVGSGVAVAVDASTARWSALGASYSSEALRTVHSAEASAARWSALGDSYMSKVAVGLRRVRPGGMRWVRPTRPRPARPGGAPSATRT